MLAVGLLNGKVEILDGDTFKKIHTLHNNSNCILSICFSPDGKYLACSYINRTIKIWDSKEFQILNVIILDIYDADMICFSPNGKYLASLSYNKTIEIWDCDNNYNRINVIQSRFGGIFSICFSPDNDKIIYSCIFQTINFVSVHKKSWWDFSNSNLKLDISNMLSVFCSPNGKYLVGITLHDTVEIFDYNNMFQKLFTLAACFKTRLCFSHNSKYLALGSWDTIIKIFDCTNNFQELYTLNTNSNITSICFSLDGKYFIAGCSNGTIKIWDVINNFQEINMLHISNYRIVSICSQSEQDEYILK